MTQQLKIVWQALGLLAKDVAYHIYVILYIYLIYWDDLCLKVAIVD